MDFKDYLELTEGLNQWETKPLFGLESLYFADGPHGLRKQLSNLDPFGKSSSYIATSFPTASLTSCSFDKKLLEEMGAALALEAKALNVHVLLGPGVNIKRSPLCGRNFEYFSEDPLLAGQLAAAYVRGVQNNGVGVSVKHFFANNQEQYRYTVNSVIDKRAMREIYLRPFEIVVRENPATIMTSYNQVNGFYVNSHRILKRVVRDEWGYDGVLISDWGATFNKYESIVSSHDLEMPSSNGFYNSFVEGRLHHSEIQTNLVETKRRIENLIKKYRHNYDISVDFDKQHEIARHIARESMVLLKNNENILPLSKDERILITGPFIDSFRYQGAGSSEINPYQVDEICDIASNYSTNIKLLKGINLNNYKDEKLLNDTLNLAKDVDKIVIVLGLPKEYEAEGFDRDNINLPTNQIKLVEELSKVNPNIVLVMLGGGVMDLSIDKKAKGVLLASLSGGAGAQAILDILYGYPPSGRLSETYINKLSDCNVQLSNHDLNVYYDESIYVGYRYYDTFDIPVKYPFGYGLSYTEFEYSNLKCDLIDNKLVINFDIENIGKCDSKEVIQIYIGAPKTSVYKPKKELRLFDKIFLKIGEKKSLSYVINTDDLRYYDIYQDIYNLEDGIYKVYVSKDVKTHALIGEIYISGIFKSHPQTSYLNSEYDTSDFKDIYHLTLPVKRPKLKRPYNLNSTLEDLQNTLMGKILARTILKIATKELKDLPENLKNLTQKMLKTTPLRLLANYGGDAFNFNMAQGIIDIANLKLFKGIRKLRTK